MMIISHTILLKKCLHWFTSELSRLLLRDRRSSGKIDGINFCEQIIQPVYFILWLANNVLSVVSILEYLAHMYFPKITGPTAQTPRNLGVSWFIQTNVQG